MTEYGKEAMIQKELVMPVCVKVSQAVLNPERLLEEREACVSFRDDCSAAFTGEGAYVVLDFGKELCGGVRLITGSTPGPARVQITFGESLTEACSSIGEKNATNDHSPRDFQAVLPSLSDLTFGASGFRFAKIRLLSDGPVYIRNIFAVNTLPYIEKEGFVKTGDGELNRIIDTAAYTLKLNLQNGYIWDGIKRDRLVWSGDLHQEILLSVYLHGDHRNITNSLRFLREETSPGAWINGIPAYSAWWVLNLCDYYRLSGDRAFFEESRAYALAVLENIDRCVSSDGEMDFSVAKHFMPYFLDWPTLDTPEAKIGTAALLVYMAKTYLRMEENSACRSLISKLSAYLNMDCSYKQIRAFQILAGRDPAGQAEFLEKNGAEGFSTFMAYYILKADAMAGGKNMLPMIKEYFGGMLSRGATTFWEDFDIRWLEGSGRIDEFPAEGQKDIHGDFGAYCYQGFRHSLCHGWSSGVLAFLIEYMIGLTLEQGGEKFTVSPNMLGVDTLQAKLPVRDGWLQIRIDGDSVTAEKTAESNV